MREGILYSWCYTDEGNSTEEGGKALCIVGVIKIMEIPVMREGRQYV